MKTYKTPLKRYSLKGEDTSFPKVKIKASKDVNEFVRKFYHDDIEIYESVFILLLNRANNTIGYAKISQGGVVGSIIDVKIVAKYCVDSLASGIVLIHNHPSGSIIASQADRQITTKIKEALKFFDVQVTDHVIIAPEQDQFYSFADEGLI